MSLRSAIAMTAAVHARPPAVAAGGLRNHLFALVGAAVLACELFGSGIANGAAEDGRIRIAAAGTSRYVIVIPDQADRGRIGKATSLLQQTVKEASGALLPITLESEKPEEAPALYLGKTQAARRAALPVGEIQGWAYLYQAKGDDIFIVGDDAQDDIKDERGIVEHLGTLKGVTAFLEDQFGVRFLLPGVHGIRIPKREPLTVDATAKRSWQPIFDYVTGRAPRDLTLAVALNLFRTTPVVKSYGGHSYYTAVPEKTYGRSNPEYFILKGGIRTARGNHLCISNPQVQELMLKEMERQLDNGYQMVELAQTDGYESCQCEKCLRIHPEPAEQLWIVHRKLAQEMKTRRPGKNVMLLSYGPTVATPKTFSDFPDNVVVQMCAYTPEWFEQWRPYNVRKTVYIYNWGWWKVPGYFGPARTPSYVVDQIRHFRENGVVGIYLCGGYQKSNYGLEGPALYAFGKALENPHRPPEELLEDYVNSLFAEAAAPMRSFYRSLYDRLETYSCFDRPNVEMGDTPNSLRSPVDYYCHCLPAELINGMANSLERARAMAEDEKVKAVLQMVELEFNFVRSVSTVFHVYRAYRMKPAQPLFDELSEAVAAHLGMVDALYDEDGRFINRYPTGLPLLFAKLPKSQAVSGGRGRADLSLNPPFSWDFASLKKKGILPGTGKPKRVEVRKAENVKLEPDLDSPDWRSVPFQELSEISLGGAKNASRFKVLYDDDAVYFGVECEYGSTKWLESFRPMGRDGNAWAQECVELAIDPYGERERHCQLVFNPVPNSTYDARLGYIDDPLHPLYGKRETSWNGDWEYAARIDKAARKWTAVVRIPFRTLGAPPPEPGTMWTLNVCRAEWPEGRGHGKPDPVYSTWSPNLESRSFHDRASFGEAVFK